MLVTQIDDSSIQQMGSGKRKSNQYQKKKKKKRIVWSYLIKKITDFMEKKIGLNFCFTVPYLQKNETKHRLLEMSGGGGNV